MNLTEKSLEVREVFKKLEVETSRFTRESKLFCFTGCGKCCMNPNISASVLEFLPLAYDLYQEGKADEALELIESTGEEGYCILFKKTSAGLDTGHCTDYKNRGLICRLFGNSVRKDKHGGRQLITCKKIKEGQEENFSEVSQKINGELQAPSAQHYYSQLYDIDEKLSEEQYPINIAIKKALEKVLMYSFYFENQEK
jgi:uncharacterized protein